VSPVVKSGFYWVGGDFLRDLVRLGGAWDFFMENVKIFSIFCDDLRVEEGDGANWSQIGKLGQIGVGQIGVGPQ
jgi:hypothetical protein